MPSRARRVRRTALLTLAASWLPAVLATPEAAGPLGAATPLALIDSLENAWGKRDQEGYLRLWTFDTPEARAEEAQFAAERFRAEETVLQIQRPPAGGPEASPLELSARAFMTTEPRAYLEEWLLRAERGPEGWSVKSRRAQARIDGLLHLSLDPKGFRADGLSLRLEDFELQMTKGTLFTSPPAIGPTVLVFVGQGTVSVRPKPAAEQEQLRQFSGAKELNDTVKAAFVRIHPSDLDSVLAPLRLEESTSAPADFGRAQEFYAEHIGRAFVLDATLPRSPWWLAPSVGDAAVTFRTARSGTLTFSMSNLEPEAISLFDRSKRIQVCLYPREGRDTRYSEDEGRTVDVLEHDLRVRFEPARRSLEGEDTLRLKLLAPVTTLQLRLDDGLRVDSVRSREGGDHLFFRVRNQDRIMVSLGALSGRLGEIALTVRYGGLHAPTPIEREVIESAPQQRSPQAGDEDVPIEDVLVYSNKTAWYPQVGTDDFGLARLRFDVPLGYLAATGGRRVARSDEKGRTLIEYRQELPSKYISVAVGRLREVTGVQLPIPIEALAVARTRGETPELVERTAAILRFYEELFGPCPYPALRLVVIEGRTPGGHSPPGMVILSQQPFALRRMLRDDPVGFTDLPGYFLAHELAHQWWGHGIAGQNYRERWLSEAFAQYAALLWVRKTLGEEKFREVLERTARWALKESDKGPIHLGHRLGHVKGDPQIYRAIVYDKGAYVLHMLQRVIGEEAFRAGLKAFQTAHRFGKAGAEDLREALERSSGKDLSPYFREWVYGTTLPRLEVTRHADKTSTAHRTIVEVKAWNLPGAVPLSIALSHAAGTESRTVTLEPTGGSWVFDTQAAAKKVEVNADRGLLARITQR